MHYLENWVKQADPQVAWLIIDIGTALSIAGLIVSTFRTFIGG